jgi:hypothetical protein
MGVHVPGIIRRGVVVGIVEERVIERVVGVEIRVVVVPPVWAAEEDRDAPGGPVVVAAAGEGIAPIVVDRPVISGIVMRGVGLPFHHVIGQEIVIEISLGHSTHQLIELRLGIAREAGWSQRPIIPVVAHDESLEPEWCAGYRRVHGSPALPVGFERLTVAPTPHFVLLSAANEVVSVRIDREQDSEKPFRVNMEDQQIAVLLRPHLDLGIFARQKTAIVTDPDLNGGVVVELSCCRLKAGIGGNNQGKEQGGDHGTSRIGRAYGMETTVESAVQQ